MKRNFLILVAICISFMAFANQDFDKTVNYQFDNAKAYEGEILYLIPIAGSQYAKISNKYQHFKNYESFKDDSSMENELITNYKFNVYNPLDDKIGGTDKRHLEGHRFKVLKVANYRDYKCTWVFHLLDLDTGEKVKFLYHHEYYTCRDDFWNFPFIVKKHFDYCCSLIETNLVFGTVNIDNYSPSELVGYYFPMFINDVNTGEPIKYDNVYAKWKITDVMVDSYRGCICFIVTNGKNTAKVPYNIQYYSEPNQHNVGNRVFPEKVWNDLVNKYGEAHMKMIMTTKMSDDMSLDEKYMAGGGRFADEPNKIETFFNKSEEEIIEDIKKGSKNIIKNAKTYITIMSTLKNAFLGNTYDAGDPNYSELMKLLEN